MLQDLLLWYMKNELSAENNPNNIYLYYTQIEGQMTFLPFSHGVPLECNLLHFKAHFHT